MVSALTCALGPWTLEMIEHWTDVHVGVTYSPCWHRGPDLFPFSEKKVARDAWLVPAPSTTRTPVISFSSAKMTSFLTSVGPVQSRWHAAGLSKLAEAVT